ncbi:MAG: DNA mismatch repair endonuclease MutL [Cyclobacteriaceae bacterium]|nr:DNA mismatch repair endonuclease MutL [Cyclobacteriaceae bacterium]
MSDIIKLLPDSIANQIAAGEVVQRPASVVKELLENSIDAGARNIQLIIKDAGRTLIQVVDDGLGMSETDARMSFERHATSKIRVSEDLFSIKTMGFRGEALASIAAVAQVEMKTRTQNHELATHIIVEGSDYKSQKPAAHPVGTSIWVKNLFFNVPARRNFLKSNPVEMRHIMDEFQRVALAHPEISFSLYQHDLETYNLKPGKLGMRIVDLFGKNYRLMLIPCEEQTPEISIQGYIGKPEAAKKSRGEQYFFVNKRFIKSNYLNYAVSNAFAGLMPEDHFPFFVLFIEIDPRRIDVNVHPTKTEIKFEDERTLYALLQSSVKKALGMHNITPSLDFSFDVNFLRPNTGNSQNYNKADWADKQSRSSAEGKWEEMFRIAGSTESFENQALHELRQAEKPTEIIFGSSANEMQSSQVDQLFTIADRERLVFFLHNRYIITQVKSGLMFIDHKAAWYRILYERFVKQHQARKSSSQQILFPETIVLNPKDYSLVMELADELMAHGFHIEEFGPNTLAIKGVPAGLENSGSVALLESIIEECKKNFNQFTGNKSENIARITARYISSFKNQKYNNEEMTMLIDQLFACENPNYTPDGKKCFTILKLDNISDLFNH